jgi:lincosamide nucleotidyltransferase A/C/D/E
VTGETVLDLLGIFESEGIDVRLDGGWGVDALVGRQSRPHDDLDVVVRLAQATRIQELLASQGFALSQDQLPIRFVMANPELGRIDFHTVVFDAEGGGVQPQPSGGTFRYPPEGFTFGTILGHRVPCISAEVQVWCHMGYEPTEKDARDMLLLREHFGVHLPRAYLRFGSGGPNT